MPQGKRVPDKTRAEIVQHYSTTGIYDHTAKKFKVAANTVKAIVKEYMDNGELAEYCDLKKREFVKLAWELEIRALNVAAEKIEAAPLRDVTTFFGVLDDKRARAAGEATEIVEARSFQLQVTADGRVGRVSAA